MKIKVRRFTNSEGVKTPLPKITAKGDWIDLVTKENETLLPGEYKLIPLGIAVELPAGCEAVCVPRSSTFKRHCILLANSFGVIDNSYCGNGDEWQFPALCMSPVETVNIPAGTRIAQFRVQLSQFATPWQKIKWLFSRKVEIEEVAILTQMNRGGIGSTGN